MSDDERRGVGDALDLLAGVLGTYVDRAMTTKYGNGWTDQVAKEEAERRKWKHQFTVSKDDLSVQLRQIQFKRIEPWATLERFPQVRAYAAEILSIRNLWAHNAPLQDEHERLIDTIGRLLDSLDLPRPQGLVSGAGAGSSNNARAAIHAREVALPDTNNRSPAGTPSLVEEAVARFGEAVRRPAELYLQYVNGRHPFAGERVGESLLSGEAPNFAVVLSSLLRVQSVLDEIETFQAEGTRAGSNFVRALALLTKHALLDPINPVHKAEWRNRFALLRGLEVEVDSQTARRGQVAEMRELLMDDDQIRGVFKDVWDETTQSLLEYDAEQARPSDEEARHRYEQARLSYESEWYLRHPLSELSEPPPLAPAELRAKAIELAGQERAEDEVRLERALSGADEPLHRSFETAREKLQVLRSAFDQATAGSHPLLREGMLLASRLPEGIRLIHQVLLFSKLAVVLHAREDDASNESREHELEYLREAIAQQRVFIGLAPVADLESERFLAVLLRGEGGLCNDLGRSEEAIRAFARADEIVDRFPMADPSLHSIGD